jgi:DNA topoisomerase-3
MEHGRLKRDAFMAEIAKMAERIVRKAKEYDRDTIPGDYATLATPCPNCGGVVKENYRRFACTGARGGLRRLRLLHHQDPGRPRLRDLAEAEPSCATRRSARWRASAPRPAGPSRPS